MAMTSAPKSESTIVANGPGAGRARARILRSSNGSMAGPWVEGGPAAGRSGDVEELRGDKPEQGFGGEDRGAVRGVEIRRVLDEVHRGDRVLGEDIEHFEQLD